MTGRIYLSEEELALLIRESEKRGPLAVTFGPAGVALEQKNGGVISSWALPIIGQMRGVLVDNRGTI